MATMRLYATRAQAVRDAVDNSRGQPGDWEKCAICLAPLEGHADENPAEARDVVAVACVDPAE